MSQAATPALSLSKGGCGAPPVAAWFDKLTTRVEVAPGAASRGSDQDDGLCVLT